jgi:RNA 3'-terminal phosphate cyclase (ATP)
LEGLTKLAGGKIQGGTVGSPFVTFHSSASNLDCDSFVINTGSGALTHAVQAALPVMLSRSAALGGSEVEVCFRGATNLCRWNGEGGFEILPPIEYMKLVLFPVLRRLFGITLALDVRRKGFGSLGEVFVRASADQWPLPCFEMLDRGEAASLSGVTYSSAGIPRNVLSRFLQGQLRKKDAGAAIVFKEALPPLPQHFTCQGDLPNDDGVACGLVLAIITTSGCCFGGDSMGRKGVAAEAVGEEAARKAVLAFQRGGCADEHLEDWAFSNMTRCTMSTSMYNVEHISVMCILCIITSNTHTQGKRHI